MSQKKAVNAKTTLTMNHLTADYKSKSTITLTKELMATVDRIRTVLEGLTGLDAAITLILNRAVQAYEAELLTLLNRAVRLSSAEKPSDTALMTLAADIQDERGHLFETANRTKDRYKPAFGHVPTLEEITGHSLGEPAPKAADRMVRDLEKLMGKLKAKK